MNKMDINKVICAMKQSGVAIIKSYADKDESYSWFLFIEETVARTIEALIAVKNGTEPQNQPRFHEFEREVSEVRTTEKLMDLAIEYAIMGFDYDLWLLKHRKSSSRSHTKMILLGAYV